jgi:hypothetical protein
VSTHVLLEKLLGSLTSSLNDYSIISPIVAPVVSPIISPIIDHDVAPRIWPTRVSHYISPSEATWSLGGGFTRDDVADRLSKLPA